MKLVTHEHNGSWYIGKDPKQRPTPKVYTGLMQRTAPPTRRTFGRGLWTGSAWASTYNFALKFASANEAEEYIEANRQRMEATK